MSLLWISREETTKQSLLIIIKFLFLRVQSVKKYYGDFKGVFKILPLALYDVANQ